MTDAGGLAMIDKVARVGLLYDIYGSLLTVRQQELVELYYFDDWSLAEVAEMTKVSRQAVHDNLRRAEELLEGYESKLQVLTKREKRRDAVEKFREIWSGVEPLVPAAIATIVDKAVADLQQQVE